MILQIDIRPAPTVSWVDWTPIVFSPVRDGRPSIYVNYRNVWVWVGDR